MSGAVLLFITTFLACAVEAVEALTIVLALGLSRGWRSALQGVAAGLVALALVIAVLGPALSRVPLDALRLFVGCLILIFGLSWLRKAILRSSGYKQLHDEQAIYAQEVRAAQTAERTSRYSVPDWYTFTLSFKAVLLEGLEVAFITVTLSANHGNLAIAVAGALAAIIGVTVAGAVLHRPLARVPENALKYVVGLILVAFGTFWAAEGAGVHWPADTAALVGLVVFYTAVAVILTIVLRRVHDAQLGTAVDASGRQA